MDRLILTVFLDLVDDACQGLGDEACLRGAQVEVAQSQVVGFRGVAQFLGEGAEEGVGALGAGFGDQDASGCALVVDLGAAADRSCGRLVDQAGGGEDVEVVRDVAFAGVQLCRELADRRRACSQREEQTLAQRVRECRELLGCTDLLDVLGWRRERRLVRHDPRV
ncbi:hypothetical protein VM98_26275 [Streptomyces rubellomurinus subsp. indigoferus]|nr:hypothetical protein VM98_26275 [Streptomyces rubellomurinus subsp. indigoferus]